MDNKNKIVVDLCGGTGEWARPYKEAGYTVHTLTLPDYDVTNFTFDDHGGVRVLGFQKINDDVLRIYRDYFWIPVEKIYGILAAPPCTMFSIARNDKTAKKPRDLKEGLKTIDAVMNIVRGCLLYHYRKDESGLKFWALENPTTGYLERFLGKAPFKFQPCDFGDPYTKRTRITKENRI